MVTLLRALSLICAPALPGAVFAQDYPTRTIKFVVPFPAGGPADTISRILTEKMGTVIG